MKIETKNICDLIPASYNPRADLQPGSREYEDLKKSIQKYGYCDPIIFNERTGRVVGGHQRLKVLQEMGNETVDVSVVDLDETQEKQLNTALNKISGKWDNVKLSELMKELSNVDDLFTGFSDDEMKKLAFGEEGLQGMILNEKEIDISHKTVDAATEIFTERMKEIERLAPEKLNRAAMVIIPSRKGSRELFILSDPGCADAIAELKRYAAAGEVSPLECLFQNIFSPRQIENELKNN